MFFFNQNTQSNKFAKGGGVLYTNEKNPINYIKKMGAKMHSNLNYSTEYSGINYYIGQKGDKAIVVAFIDDDNYFMSKEDAREMAITAKTKGIETVELYTDYGIELHSKNETPQSIGFDKIYKVVSDSFAKGGDVSLISSDESFIINNADGEVVVLDDGIKYKIKAKYANVIYPYKHTIADIVFEPVSKTSEKYKYIKKQLGDDWLTDWKGMSDENRIKVLQQLGKKQFADGGEISDSMLNYVANHLSSGYISSRLHEYGLEEGTYQDVDYVRTLIINELTKQDKEYSVQDLNALIKRYAIVIKAEKTHMHTYMMLARLQSDCNYYLGFGNRHEKHLWAGNVADHINEMKKLWNSLPADAKPEWITMQQIEIYEKDMLNPHGEVRDGEVAIDDEYLNTDTKKHFFVTNIDADGWVTINTEKGGKSIYTQDILSAADFKRYVNMGLFSKIN
jgi:hypothetical protein